MTRRDTIDVRSEEQLDQKKLAAYLAEHLEVLPITNTDFSLRQFGGGMANLTYELDFGPTRLVLRRPPLGPIAASAHDMEREYRVLSLLYRDFPLAPRAYLFCGDATVIGAPFFIMERRYGTVVRTSLPAGMARDPRAPRKMSQALVDALADLHRVNYADLGLADLGRPAGFIERQIEGWFRRWEKARVEPLSEMEAVFDWLKDHIPDEAGASLVHNDYKLDNVMLADEDPGRLVAIFDWDMCTLGDPLSDLGALLTYWWDPDDPPFMRRLAETFMPAGTPGFLTREELVARYAERSGRDVSRISFYHALGIFRLAVIIAQIYIRYVRGQTRDPRFASLGGMLPLLARAAKTVAGLPS